MTAALFDMDGTLVDSEPRSMAVWALLLEENGLPYDETLIRSFMGRRGKDVFPEVLHMFPGRTTDDLIAETRALVSRPALPPIGQVAGAVPLVTTLAQLGVPIGVVTSGWRGYADDMLSSIGVRHLLDTVVTAEDVADGKPHPAGYLLGCERLGADPASTVAFEDSPAGIAAAKAAGLYCVGLTTTHAAAELAAADSVVEDLSRVAWPIDVPA
ncbi:MAG: HAD-IA family hydrolase [Streptosporangiales bacterium]|nr:HAD-IA family hydrolase [Streptosporangiales bacterium]